MSCSFPELQNVLLERPATVRASCWIHCLALSGGTKATATCLHINQAWQSCASSSSPALPPGTWTMNPKERTFSGQKAPGNAHTEAPITTRPLMSGVFGLCGKILVVVGLGEGATVRSSQKAPMCLTETMPDCSKMDQGWPRLSLSVTGVVPVG